MDKSIRELYEEHKGKVSDKWNLYLDEWDRLLAPYREQEIHLLEIGVQNGGSLEIWSKVFINGERFIGCDIDQKCAELHYDDPRISIVIGDATTNECEERITSNSPTFDIIIDDGSHKSSEIVRSFGRYYPHLNDNGIYIIEDLHCSYWESFEGGIHQPFSSIAFFKRLTDILNFEHWRSSITRRKYLDEFSLEFGMPFDDRDLARIHSIEFVNSLCIIRKQSPENNELSKRMVVGTEESVITGWTKFYGTTIRDISAEMKDDSSPDLFELIKQNKDWGQEIEDFSKKAMVQEQELKRLSAKLVEIKQEKDKKAIEQEQELKQLSAELAELRRERDKYEIDLSQKKQVLQTLFSRLAKEHEELIDQEKEKKTVREELETRTLEANKFSSQLWEIHHSRAWSLVQFMWKLRLRIFPSGSVQTRLIHSIYNDLRVVKSKGMLSYIKYKVKRSNSPSSTSIASPPATPSNYAQNSSPSISLVHPDPVYIPKTTGESLKQNFAFPERSVQPDDPAGLFEKVTRNIKHNNFLVSISHDDYLTINFGGIQMFMADEQKSYEKQNISYLHLYPLNDADYLQNDAQIVIGLNVDSVHIGQYLMDDIVKLLGALIDTKYVCVGTIMHHFKGWTLNALESLLSAVHPIYHLFYLHDFFSLCPQYVLLRNQREFCNAPPINSDSCTICAFGVKRKLHMPYVSSLFTSYPFLIIAPSKTAKTLWQKVFPELNNEIRIVPHLSLKETTASLPDKGYKKINIAYAGQGVRQKGWDYWRKVVSQFSSCSDYKFFHLGSWVGEYPEFFESIRVTSQNRTAMMEALHKHKIDVLFQWSISPETFSFVLYEAISTGCFVLTTDKSGNISDYVNENKNGRVFSSYDELADYLSTPDNLRNDLSEFRRKHPMKYELEKNNTIVDLVGTALRSGGSE